MKDKIREASISDLEEIKRLNHLLLKKEVDESDDTLNIKWSYTDKADKYFRDSIENDYVLVQEKESKISGYMIGKFRGGSDSREKISSVELDNMYIEEDERGRGVGTKMIEMLEAWAKKKKANRLKVGVFAKNKKARNFYNKLKLKEYKIILEKKI